MNKRGIIKKKKVVYLIVTLLVFTFLIVAFLYSDSSRLEVIKNYISENFQKQVISSSTYPYVSDIPNKGHGADDIFIFVNGNSKELQQAITDGDFNSGFTGDNTYSGLSDPGHIGGQVIINVNNTVKILQEAINDDSLCKTASGTNSSFGNITGQNHTADKILIDFNGEKTLQEAINAGDFYKCPPISPRCAGEVVSLNVQWTLSHSCGGSFVIEGISVGSGSSGIINTATINIPAGSNPRMTLNYDKGHDHPTCCAEVRVSLSGSDVFADGSQEVLSKASTWNSDWGINTRSWIDLIPGADCLESGDDRFLSLTYSTTIPLCP